MTQTITVQTDRQTDGLWVHTGQLILNYKLPNGTVVKITLPDDLVRLMNLDSLEDLKYGN